MHASAIRWAQLNKANAQVLGISTDTFFALKAFQDQQQLSFPLLSDFNKEVIRDYGVFNEDMIGLKGIAKRAVFVIDKDGVVRLPRSARRRAERAELPGRCSAASRRSDSRAGLQDCRICSAADLPPSLPAILQSSQVFLQGPWELLPFDSHTVATLMPSSATTRMRRPSTSTVSPDLRSAAEASQHEPADGRIRRGVDVQAEALVDVVRRAPGR